MKSFYFSSQLLKSSIFTSTKNSTRKKVQLKKKFNSKWPGNLPSKIKDALSGVPFIRRSNCIGMEDTSIYEKYRWSCSLGVVASRANRVYEHGKRGMLIYHHTAGKRAWLSSREGRDNRGLQLIHVFS